MAVEGEATLARFIAQVVDLELGPDEVASDRGRRRPTQRLLEHHQGDNRKQQRGQDEDHGAARGLFRGVTGAGRVVGIARGAQA